MHLALNEVREHKNEYHNEPYPQGPNCIAEKADNSFHCGPSHFVNNFIFSVSQKSPNVFTVFIYLSLSFTLRLQNFPSYHLVSFFFFNLLPKQLLNIHEPWLRDTIMNSFVCQPLCFKFHFLTLSLT